MASGTPTRRIPYGIFRRLEFTFDNPFSDVVIQIVYYDCSQKIEKILYVWSSSGKPSLVPNCGDPEARHDIPGSTIQVVDAVRVDGSDEGCTECTFTVYRNQEIVHSETREECPEVEQLPCRLSDVIKEVEIDKVSYLQRIEVRNHGIGYAPIAAPLYKRYEIPSECLNIYNTDIWAAPFVLV